MRIRTATERDSEVVRAVHESAFPAVERDRVAKLAVHLLPGTIPPATLSLVAVIDGDVVGHIAFSPVTIQNDAGLRGYILAPLGVKPDHHGCGLGSSLVREGLRQLSELGVDIVFVYGDPAFYGRHGFSRDAAHCHVPPFNLTHPMGWQAIALSERGHSRTASRLECVAALCDPSLW